MAVRPVRLQAAVAVGELTDADLEALGLRFQHPEGTFDREELRARARDALLNDALAVEEERVRGAERLQRGEHRSVVGEHADLGIEQRHVDVGALARGVAPLDR
mgnify:CR=1 FL=1